MAQDDWWFAASIALTLILTGSGYFILRRYWVAAMDSLGLALIVGGAAFVVSGLVFLLPGARRRREQQETIDQSREQIEFHLRAMRRNQGDLS